MIGETNYFDELESPNRIAPKELEVKDYNSYHADASPKPSMLTQKDILIRFVFYFYLPPSAPVHCGTT